MAELKLGKLPPVIDERTIKLSAILKTELLPELPASYDIDEVLGVSDNFMFNNSTYGDCVIAAQAHQTLRFEKFEQGCQIPITDKEVVDEYHKQAGNLPGWEDRGLILLNAIKKWRKEGWTVNGKTYTIYAFASVDWKNHDQVKQCIYLLGGVNFGMAVFQTDIDQFNAGEPWTITPYNSSLRGGHGVYAPAYKYRLNPCDHCATGWTEDYISCVTWGRRQNMSWEFWDARVDEAYGIVDNKNHWMADTSPVDIEKLDAILHEITGTTTDEPAGCAPFASLIKRLFQCKSI
jgi:hypothetical protein